jgi:hypothetical protein
MRHNPNINCFAPVVYFVHDSPIRHAESVEASLPGQFGAAARAGVVSE